MRYDEVVSVLGSIAAADGTAYAVVGALSLIVFLVMWAMLPVKSLALVYAPVLFWSGLTGLYAATSLGIQLSSDKAANVAGTAALGMIVGLILMVILTRLLVIATRLDERGDAAPGRPVSRI